MSIINGGATLTCPPHTPEIDAIVYGRAATTKPQSKEAPQVATLSNNPTILPIAYFQPPSGYYVPTSSPKKKRRRCVEYSDDLNSSPMGFYSSKDYYNSALQDYTSWCADKYGEHEFAEAFQ